MAKPAASKAQVAADPSPLRLIFMGMGGQLSAAPLAVLLEAGYTFCAVVIAARHSSSPWRRLTPQQHAPRSVPLLSPARSILQLGWEHELPVYEARALQAGEVTRALQQLAPDAVLVSCFPYRVPPQLLNIPAHGFLNLHPSLLPAYRGPYPLFWQLRDGLQRIGLTVHRMDERLDTGPIARQSSAPLQDGMAPAEINRLLGHQGGLLFAELLEALASGSLALQPQGAGGSYQGRPQAEDFTLDRQWSARRAFNFMRGTADWGQPYTVHDGGQRWQVRRALGYEPDGLQRAAVQQTDGRLRIQFQPGILEAA